MAFEQWLWGTEPGQFHLNMLSQPKSKTEITPMIIHFL